MEKRAIKVSVNTIIINVVLSLAKLAAGVIGHSSAMISDAIHSASDVFSTVIAMVGIKAAGKASDNSHQYGHERLECVASIGLAVVLFATGAGIGFEGIRKILGGNYTAIVIPSALPLAAAAVSILVKEWMYWYTRRAAKSLNSGVLLADAWHHRSDALSSVGSLIGILGARLGMPVFDPAASVVICLFIVKVAYDIFRDAVIKLTDHSCDQETETAMREFILDQDGVLALDILQTRLFGSKIYVDIEISVLGEQSLREAHDIAQRVHDGIEHAFSNVKHCMIHVNPEESKEAESGKSDA